MTDDGIEDLSVEEAVEQHFDGAIHCCLQHRWAVIASQIIDLDFIEGHVGKTWPKDQPDLWMICVDTTGFTPEQANAFLAIWYSGDDVGVSSMTSQSVYDAAEAFRKKKGKR
jgi:hypothetical protein